MTQNKTKQNNYTMNIQLVKDMFTKNLGLIHGYQYSMLDVA